MLFPVCASLFMIDGSEIGRYHFFLVVVMSFSVFAHIVLMLVHIDASFLIWK